MISSCAISKNRWPPKKALTAQRKPPASQAATRSFTRRSTRSKRLRSSSFGSILPVIASVTSFTEWVTKTREPGPFESSSSRVLARKPFTRRFRCGVELNWSDP